MPAKIPAPILCEGPVRNLAVFSSPPCPVQTFFNVFALAMCWFVSTFICLILEGAYFGAAQNSIINDLSIMTTITLGPLIVQVFNVNFAQGIMRLLLWDYSFYTGGWIIIRYFWVCTLSSGAVWGIIQAFIWLYGQAISFITQLV